MPRPEFIQIDELMIIFTTVFRRSALLGAVSLLVSNLQAQIAPAFRAVAFYTGRDDKAHISFVHESLRWFPEMAAQHNFEFVATTNWSQLNPDFLKEFQVVLFLDTRPEDPAQRQAFQDYMDHGGAWMGFHFAAFAMNDSGVKQNWDWYHNTFLGSGEYVGNTWKPTAALLRIEDTNFPGTKGLPERFISAPNEWYKWKNDVRANPDIDVLLSIDPISFPLGTGPKLYEIWHSGDYPVVWANRKFKMIYFNFGHNDIDYEHKTDKELSFTFANAPESKLILDSLLWLGTGKQP